MATTAAAGREMQPSCNLLPLGQIERLTMMPEDAHSDSVWVQWNLPLTVAWQSTACGMDSGGCCCCCPWSPGKLVIRQAQRLPAVLQCSCLPSPSLTRSVSAFGQMSCMSPAHTHSVPSLLLSWPFYLFSLFAVRCLWLFVSINFATDRPRLGASPVIEMA